MRATYDPAISYYVTKLPKVSASDLATVDSEFIQWIVNTIAGRKVTGDAAKTLLKQTLASMDVEGQELVKLIIDRKIGASVGDTMVLKTWPNLYFIPPYMRCSSMDKKMREYYEKLEYFYVQAKRDGSFAYLSQYQIATRQGSVYPEWFVKMMARGVPSNIRLVGELEVSKWNGDSCTPMSRKEGNGVLNSILQGADQKEFEGIYEFTYTAWDCLDESEFEIGRSEKPQEKRFENLKQIVETLNRSDVQVVYNEKVTSVAQANAIHIRETKAGREGTVWKTAEGIWRDSSSGTKDAVKNKVVFECEYEVVSYYEGEGKAAGMLGGVTIKTSCGRLVNNLGSGFTDKQRKEFWEVKETLPGRIFAVEANDLTDSRGKQTVSLSLPVFIEERFDKKVADSFERVWEQFKAAAMGKETN